MSGDVAAFIDNLRAPGIAKDHAWRVVRWVCSTFQYLELQDATRKRRPLPG